MNDKSDSSSQYSQSDEEEKEENRYQARLATNNKVRLNLFNNGKGDDQYASLRSGADEEVKSDRSLS